jgi:hypothetical protein
MCGENAKLVKSDKEERWATMKITMIENL